MLAIYLDPLGFQVAEPPSLVSQMKSGMQGPHCGGQLPGVVHDARLFGPCPGTELKLQGSLPWMTWGVFGRSQI